MQPVFRYNQVSNLYDSLTELLKRPPDIPKDEEIIVACGIGYRGNIAASFLQGLGFEHVHSLDRGMKAWVNGGYPVVT